MVARTQLYQYKGNRCACCGRGVQEILARYGTIKRLFHFHHVEPTTKAEDYKRLMAQRLSRRQLSEIDKCVLLCVECHNLVHSQEIRARLTLTSQIETRIVSQAVEGWVKADLYDRTMTFVTNEPYLLHPCAVRVGKLPERLLFVREIEEDSNLHQWIRDIAFHKSIEIYSLQLRRTAMQINHIEGLRVSIEQATGFPVCQLEFHAENVPGEVIYFQNGVVLMQSGAVHTSGSVSYEFTLR